MNAIQQNQLASLIYEMHPATVIDLVGALALGRFSYHPTLTIFLPKRGVDRGHALAVGEWLMRNREAVQNHFRETQRAGAA